MIVLRLEKNVSDDSTVSERVETCGKSMVLWKYNRFLLPSMQLKLITTLGRWPVWMNSFFLTVIIISFLLVLVLRVLNFDDRWWDVAVAVLFPASIIAFILAVIAIRKHGEKCSLVYGSAAIGELLILFIFLHSLFIND